MNSELKTVKRGSWKWHVVSEDVLEPWFDVFKQYEANPVKRNPVRSVFKVKDANAAEYYVKHDTPQKFTGKLKTVFRSKVKKEYDSYVLLRSHSIPSVEYVGWGTSFPEGMLISKTLNGSMNSFEYWLTSAVSDPAKKKHFLDTLTGLLRAFAESNLIHPDFHAGNILYLPSTGKIYLVDTYGIFRLNRSPENTDKIKLLKILTNFREELSPEEIISVIPETGIVKGCMEGLLLWDNAIAIEEENVRRKWKQRTAQILSGTSKFAVESRENNDLVFRRNTRWFEPVEYDLEKLNAVELEHSKAEKIWLDSFYADLMCKRFDEVPLAWRISKNKKDILYY